MTGVAVLNGKLYVVGGWGGQAAFAKCEMYDPETSKWRAIAPLNTGGCSIYGEHFIGFQLFSENVSMSKVE